MNYMEDQLLLWDGVFVLSAHFVKRRHLERSYQECEESYIAVVEDSRDGGKGAGMQCKGVTLLS